MCSDNPFTLAAEECDRLAAELLKVSERMQGAKKKAALADSRHYQRIAEAKRWIASDEMRRSSAG